MSLALKPLARIYLPNKAGYLVRVGRCGEPRGATHIWTSNDTACRMWSTGGLNQAKKWGYQIAPATALCVNCKRNQCRDFGSESIEDAHILAPFRHVGERFHQARDAFVKAGGNLDECPF